jgi:hypothetical protein
MLFVGKNGVKCPTNLEIANSSAKRSLSDAAKDKKQEPPKETGHSEAPAEKKVETVVKDEKLVRMGSNALPIET